MAANLENSAVSTGLEKNSFHSNPMERQLQRMFKNHTISLISHASKVMLKIVQVVRQQYMNWELPDVQAGFRKGRGIRDQIANICCTIEKAREFEKNTYFCFIDCTKLFDCVDHNKLWKILQELEYQTTLPSFCKTCMQIKKQQLELDMQQCLGSKLGKKYVKAAFCKPTYLT